MDRPAIVIFLLVATAAAALLACHTHEPFSQKPLPPPIRYPSWVDNEPGSIGSIDPFAFNTFDVRCCRGSYFSNSEGCMCMTGRQRALIRSRGGQA